MQIDCVHLLNLLHLLERLRNLLRVRAVSWWLKARVGSGSRVDWQAIGFADFLVISILSEANDKSRVALACDLGAVELKWWSFMSGISKK